MKKTETTDLKWIGRREVIGGIGLRQIGDKGLRLIGSLGVQLSGSVGGSVTSSFGGGDVEDQVEPTAVKQRGESLRE
nr:hypothetical protein CFP56_06403 [Quercus suber]